MKNSLLILAQAWTHGHFSHNCNHILIIYPSQYFPFIPFIVINYFQMSRIDPESHNTSNPLYDDPGKHWISSATYRDIFALWFCTVNDYENLCFFMLPDWMIRGILFLPCLSVVNFNIHYNLWSVGRDFIFGTHTELMFSCPLKWHQGQWPCDLYFDIFLLKIAFSEFVASGDIVFHKHTFYFCSLYGSIGI